MLATLFPLGWQHYLLGGLLIGAGISLLFAALGLRGGASSVLTTSWSYLARHAYFQQARFVDSRDWRLVYAAGMMAGALVWWLTLGPYLPVPTTVPAWQLLLGGAVAGFGARMAGGCTSGHGICGLAALRLSSLWAVLVFLAAAMISARLVLWMGGR
jgi:uncharacterized protein